MGLGAQVTEHTKAGEAGTSKGYEEGLWWVWLEMVMDWILDTAMI